MGFIYSFDERFNKIQKSFNSVSIYIGTPQKKLYQKTRHMDIYIILALYKIKFYIFEFSQTFPFCSSILTQILGSQKQKKKIRYLTISLTFAFFFLFILSVDIYIYIYIQYLFSLTLTLIPCNKIFFYYIYLIYLFEVLIEW